MPLDSGQSSETELQNLRGSISDVGHQIDSYKTKTAGALAGGVFALLLAVGAGYDLVVGKSRVWSTLGITHADLVWIAGGLGFAAIVLLGLGLFLVARRDRGLHAKLDQMEREYADLTERREPH